MIICKDLNPSDSISSLKEWFAKCPPAGGLKQWVDRRSAKETAKHWVYTIPRSFIELLKCFHLEYELCSPEYESKFDSLNGGKRNHDLLITAKDKYSKSVVISVESKVDEKFDETLAERLVYYTKVIARGDNSNLDKRIKLLKDALFTKPNSGKIDRVRYQLLTAVAGTLSESKKQGAKKAVFIVQTFLSSAMDSKKHRQNQRDLDYFLEVFTNGKHKIIHDDDLIGPIKVPGNADIPNDVELWIGKYSVRI